jgi:hypothetical protein
MRLFDSDETDREMLRQVIGLPIPKLTKEAEGVNEEAN